MKFVVTESISIIQALALISPQSSKNTLRSWIREGRVEVDQSAVHTHQLEVQPGQVVTVGVRRKFLTHGIEILYEDNDLIVIDKPSGLLSVSTAFEKEDTALALLKKHLHPRRVYVVHRLDQDTSGVMVFALNEKTNQGLKALFAKHTIDRQYVAIVEGNMEEEEGTWESYLFEDDQYVVHETGNTEEGERAITHFKKLNATRFYTQLQLILETGKKNQIRVHCQSAGHPIVGDKKYRAKSNPIKRLALHATHLGFTHPSTHKKLAFKSPLPPEFSKIMPMNWTSRA